VVKKQNVAPAVMALVVSLAIGIFVQPVLLVPALAMTWLLITRIGFRFYAALIAPRLVALVGLALAVTLIGQRTTERRINAERYAVEQERIAAIQKRLAFFKRNTGRYPTTSEGLQALVEKPTNARNNADVAKSPTDSWGHAYAYVSDGSHYLVKSYGADGQEGGEGLDQDIEGRD